MLLKLKPAVWERHGDELYLMADQREMQTLLDPDGRVEELLGLLSADAHTLETLTAGLARRFPDVSPDDVAEGISGLDSLGMVEDLAKADLLSQWQQGRYFTNLVFFQSFATLACAKEEMQRRLMDANVLILGVGGLGSMVLMQPEDHLIGGCSGTA